MNVFRNWRKLAILGLVGAGLLLGPVGADDRKIIVRKQGTVVTYEVGSNAAINVMTNRYMAAGQVETKSNSIAKIGALGGGSVLVGPETTIDVAKFNPDNPSSEAILKQGSARFRVKHRPDQDYKVRTNSAVLAARGTDFLVQVVDSYANLPLAPTASLVPDSELAQSGPFTLMQVFEGQVDVFDVDGNFFGSLYRGDTLVAPMGGINTFRYNDPLFHFMGELVNIAEMTVPDRNLLAREISTYYAENIGLTGFYNEYLDTGGFDVTGGPLLIAPGTESNGSLLLEILLPHSSSGSSSSGNSSGSNPFNGSSGGSGFNSSGTTTGGGTTGGSAGGGSTGGGFGGGGGGGT